MKTFSEWLNESISKEDLKEIRDVLKKMGYNNRKVGVSGKRGNLKLTIKSVGINADELKDKVIKYQSISRDYATQEILAGGNTFVNVEYDYDLIRSVRKVVEKYVTKDLIRSGKSFKIGNLEVSFPGNDNGVSVNKNATGNMPGKYYERFEWAIDPIATGLMANKKLKTISAIESALKKAFK